MRGGGLVVTPIGPDDLGDIGLLRVEIEGLAARLAAVRGSKADWELVEAHIEAMRTAADDEELQHRHLDVHRAIYAIGFSPRMSTFFENQVLAYIEVSVSVGPGHKADPEGSYRQHMQLLATLSFGQRPSRAPSKRRGSTPRAGGVKFARKDHQPASLATKSAKRRTA